MYISTKISFSIHIMRPPRRTGWIKIESFALIVNFGKRATSGNISIGKFEV